MQWKEGGGRQDTVQLVLTAIVLAAILVLVVLSVTPPDEAERLKRRDALGKGGSLTRLGKYYSGR